MLRTVASMLAPAGVFKHPKTDRELLFLLIESAADLLFKLSLVGSPLLESLRIAAAVDARVLGDQGRSNWTGAREQLCRASQSLPLGCG